MRRDYEDQREEERLERQRRELADEYTRELEKKRRKIEDAKRGGGGPAPLGAPSNFQSNSSKAAQSPARLRPGRFEEEHGGNVSPDRAGLDDSRLLKHHGHVHHISKYPSVDGALPLLHNQITTDLELSNLKKRVLDQEESFKS